MKNILKISSSDKYIHPFHASLINKNLSKMLIFAIFFEPKYILIFLLFKDLVRFSEGKYFAKQIYLTLIEAVGWNNTEIEWLC